MSDKIALEVAGRLLDRFVSYSVPADLYTAAASFNLELSALDIEIPEGARCRLFVNEKLALTGIADRISEVNGKSGSRVTIEGRDLMGLLVDSCVEEFVTLTDITLKALTERLIKPLPFINRSAVRYQPGLAGAVAKTLSSSSEFDTTQRHTQLEPGQTVFEVLHACALGRGAMFFAMPDGTFVFGRPLAKGKPAFKLTRRLDGRGNNVIEGSRVRDNSQRYRKIVVMAQRQGEDSFDSGGHNVLASLIDEQAPIAKTLVIVNNRGDGQTPAQEAALHKEHQRAAALHLSYMVKGHAQGNLNWIINELVEVEDEALRVHGTYLVVGRTFRLDKQEGPVTELRLGLPGVIQ